VAVGTPADARRALLERLIDHAPTFPPARLPTDEALAEDRRARASEEVWLLGRLVWPASRLGELDGYDSRVPISAVLDGQVPVPGTGTCLEALESRWPEVPDFRGEVFVELPLDDDLERNLEHVRAAGALAKVRCGGERTPSPAELARFVRACAATGVAFKASAGLHQPVRRGEQHGFLNLAAAVLFPQEADAALEDDDPVAFALDDDRFAWAGFHANAVEIRRMRRERFRSFGSCSFAEPVEDLRALGIL
jgi:hypothetical protein